MAVSGKISLAFLVVFGMVSKVEMACDQASMQKCNAQSLFSEMSKTANPTQDVLEKMCPKLICAMECMNKVVKDCGKTGAPEIKQGIQTMEASLQSFKSFCPNKDVKCESGSMKTTVTALFWPVITMLAAWRTIL